MVSGERMRIRFKTESSRLINYSYEFVGTLRAASEKTCYQPSITRTLHAASLLCKPLKRFLSQE